MGNAPKGRLKTGRSSGLIEVTSMKMGRSARDVNKLAQAQASLTPGSERIGAKVTSQQHFLCYRALEVNELARNKPEAMITYL